MRRAAGAIGRGLVTAGILILLFVVFQLWGTGLYTAREQSRLKADFNAQLARADAARTSATPEPADPATTTTTTPPPPPPEGEAVATLKIPKIGSDSAVVQGVGVADLRKGPGHYPETPLPGQLGNASIAGHRTTYGAEFNRLDELEPGDEIIVTTLEGTFRYLVDAQPQEDGDPRGHIIVPPKQVDVLDPTPDPAVPGANLATLTLTTCNPKYSAATRLVVRATFAPEQDSPAPTAPPPVTVSKRTSFDLSGAESSPGPTILWGFILAAAGALWWLVFHRYHRWTTWLAGLIPFAVVLFVFFWNLERVLPANY